jgi:hypothetical protein
MYKRSALFLLLLLSSLVIAITACGEDDEPSPEESRTGTFPPTGDGSTSGDGSSRDASHDTGVSTKPSPPKDGG